MGSIYTDGRYLRGSPSWAVDDSPWKAQQIKRIMVKNGISASTVCEVGCGAGEILRQLSDTYSSDISYTGFEISPQAYQLCKTRQNAKIQFYLDDLSQRENVFYDVLLVIDVIEHVEDLFDFLRRIRARATYKVFHIPLDMFVLNILKGSNLSRGVVHPGHVHFFTKHIALEILRREGYEICDFFYTPAFERSGGTLLCKMLQLPRRVVYNMNSDLGVRIVGGASLLVLAR